MNKQRISMRSIAQELNISAMTLYRVINNAPGVSVATRKRVVEALDKAGVFQTRSSAPQSVVLDIQDDPYKKNLAFSLLSKISNQNYNIQIADHRKSKSVFLRMIAGAQTVIFFSSPSAETVREVKEENPDIFCINVSGGSEGDIVIGMHNFLGGRIAAEHLYKNGHRNVALVTIPIEPTQLDRHKSFIGEMSVLAPKSKVHVLFLHNWKTLKRQILHLVQDKGVTAIFATCGYIAYQLQKYLLENGIRIPEQVSLLSYDFPQDMTEEYPFELDTIGVDLDQIVRMAAYYLRHRPVQDMPIAYQCYVVPELQIHGTVCQVDTKK